MVELSALATSGWFILLFAVVVSLLVFPLVVLGSFLYDFLEKKYPKAPKVLLMLLVTFVGTVVAVVVLELYLGNQLAAALTS